MLSAGALSFPTLAAEREFAIVSPAAGSTLRGRSWLSRGLLDVKPRCIVLAAIVVGC